MSMRAAELIAADLQGPRPGIEEGLKVTGVKTIPNLVDVAAVDLVYDVGQNGFNKPTFDIGSVASASIAGVSSGTHVLLGPQGFTIAGLLGTSGKVLNTEVARILGASVTVNFDAAGAAAFAGKEVRVAWDIRDFTNTPNFQCVGDNFTVVAAITSNRRALASPFWNGIVPWTMAFTVTVISQDGTNFPANTTFAVNGFYFVKRKSGASVPL